MLSKQIFGRLGHYSNIALTFRGRNEGSAIEHWSYETLLRRTEAYGQWLRTNTAKHSYVAIRMEAQGESVAALLAAEMSSTPAVLIPASLPSPETLRLLETVRPAASFLMEEFGCPAPSGWSTVADTVFGDSLSSPLDNAERATHDFVCQITSGSSGPSRLAVRTVAGVASEIAGVVGALGLTESDRVICASSIAHSYGLIGGVLAPLVQGAHVLLSGNPDDAHLLAQGCPPTILFGLYSTYLRLLAQRAERRIFSDARFILSAGAPLPKGLFSDFQAYYSTPIRQDYGTTETGTISIDCEDEAVPETVGKPLPHMEVKIRKPENDQVAEVGDGEVLVRSEAVASCILDEHGPQPSKDEDGWYHTGDSGQQAPNGLLRLGARLRQPVVLDGTVVQLRLIEEAIGRLPQVREVVAVPAQTNSAAKIKAVVVASGLDIRCVEELCRKRLPETYKFISIELIDQLPRSPAGKILEKYLV